MTRRAKRQTAPAADLGPDMRFRNGTARMVYRADPAAPHAPAIRAARAFLRYEYMGLEPAEFEAAKRISEAAELCTGAKAREGAGVQSTAFWATGGPTITQIEAARYLREVRQVLGPRLSLAVVLTVVDGRPDYEDVARAGIKTMAEFWRL